MRIVKAVALVAALGGMAFAVTTPASAAEEEMMACEAFVSPSATDCCYCDFNGNVGSCGVMVGGDGVQQCTRHLCPTESECFNN
jgi:hypothetical protein